MGVRLIRENSDVPNVSNTDDARMVRYAYGGYNGFVKGKGGQLSSLINGNVFRINSGVINLQGWEVEIDSSGWSESVNSANATVLYYVVYCELNMAADDVAKIKSVYDTTGYPTVEVGDDLTVTENGTARLPLYRFIAQSGSISNVEKLIEEIPYVNDVVDELNKRLNEMGFKEASVETGEISLESGWTDAASGKALMESPSPVVEVYKMAKIALLKKLCVRTHSGITVNYPTGGGSSITVTSKIATLPKEFCPKEDMNVNVGLYVFITGQAILGQPMNRFNATLTFQKDGSITLNASGTITGTVMIGSDYPALVQCNNLGWELK